LITILQITADTQGFEKMKYPVVIFND